MKLTKLQNEAFQKYKTLRPVALDQERIIKNFYNPVKLKDNECTCLHCGTKIGEWKKFFKQDKLDEYPYGKYIPKKGSKCPNCGKKLSFVAHINYKAWIGYFAQYQRKGDWQVIRMHFVQMMPHPNESATYKIVPDNYQIWYHPSGQRVTIAHPTGFMPRRRYNPLSEWGDMYVRKDNNTDYVNYDIDEYQVVSLAPWSRKLINNQILPKKDLGEFKKVASKVNLIYKMNKHPYFETLIKQNQTSLAEQITLQDMMLYSAQIRIAVFRNHLQIQDWSLYKDVLRYLKEFKYDMHSPKYLCPKDIKVWHDHLHDIKRAKEEANRHLAKIEEAKQYLDQYTKDKKRFFCIYIPTDDFIIRPIYTPMEMIDEGEHMHHCVGMYYKYKDSLILVCRTKDNERIATIEINIRTKNIIQIRGVQNSKPTQYKAIESVLKNRLNDILHPAKYKFKKTA